VSDPLLGVSTGFFGVDVPEVVDIGLKAPCDNPFGALDK